MRLRFFAACIFLLSTAVVLLVNATPVPTLDLDKLTNEATLIALGKVTALKETGKDEVRFDSTILKVKVEIGVIHVEQFLKGSSTSALTFKSFSSEAPIGWGAVENQAYGIFFLKPGSDGTFEFANLYYPSLPTTQGPTPSGDGPIDRVVSAINNTLKSPSSTPSQKLTAVFFLSRSKSPASSIALRATALNDPSSEIRLGGAGALLERNDTSGLDLVVKALSHRTFDSSAPLYHNLIFAISEGVKDAHAIPYLKELLASPAPEVRRAAASALMHTQAPEAIEPLLVTLEDPDFETRYYSAVGLAEITGQLDWRPSDTQFRTSQAKYLKHWREWAGNH